LPPPRQQGHQQLTGAASLLNRNAAQQSAAPNRIERGQPETERGLWQPLEEGVGLFSGKQAAMDGHDLAGAMPVMEAEERSARPRLQSKSIRNR
jgi:hypothetical protein